MNLVALFFAMLLVLGATIVSAETYSWSYSKMFNNTLKTYGANSSYDFSKGFVIDAKIKPVYVTHSYVVYRENNFLLQITGDKYVQCGIFVNGSWTPLVTSQYTVKPYKYYTLKCEYDNSKMTLSVKTDSYSTVKSKNFTKALVNNQKNINIGNNAAKTRGFVGYIYNVSLTEKKSSCVKPTITPTIEYEDGSVVGNCQVVNKGSINTAYDYKWTIDGNVVEQGRSSDVGSFNFWGTTNYVVPFMQGHFQAPENMNQASDVRLMLDDACGIRNISVKGICWNTGSSADIKYDSFPLTAGTDYGCNDKHNITRTDCGWANPQGMFAVYNYPQPVKKTPDSTRCEKQNWTFSCNLGGTWKSASMIVNDTPEMPWCDTEVPLIVDGFQDKADRTDCGGAFCDENWDTAGFEDKIMYAEYKIPVWATGAEWRIKQPRDYPGTPEALQTDIQSCFDYGMANNYTIKVRMINGFEGGGSFACYDGVSGWNGWSIIEYSDFGYFYEEGIQWLPMSVPLSLYKENADVTTCSDASCDGNWNTSAYAANSLEYNKPEGFTSAVWKVKDDCGTFNLTIPQDCFNAYSDKIALSYFRGEGFGGVHYYCSNPSETVVREVEGCGDLFEEGLYWTR